MVQSNLNANSIFIIMFSPAKIKWTIDPEHSEILFRERSLVLSGINDVSDKVNNELINDVWNINDSFSNTLEEANNHEECAAGKQSALHINIEELPKNINYNLIIFDEKDTIDFWNRKSFTGLLVSKNTGKNVLITLHYSAHSFNSRGHAAATYFAKGKLNKNDFDPDRNGIDESEIVILNSELLFEGEVRLVQNE
ncbi:MAG: hypothetical protein ABI091_08785 [Ferruginibacter sp.]